MSFESFDSAVAGFKSFLVADDFPSRLLWLVRSRIRWNRNGLYVFRPLGLTDSSSHQSRFELALQRNKNIAFNAYAFYDGHSLVGLETIGLDPPHDNFDESGSHNYKILLAPPKLIPIDSNFRWMCTKLFVRDNWPAAQCLGWPA